MSPLIYPLRYYITYTAILNFNMEKLLDMDSPSAIGDVNFCNIEVNPFRTSSISPSLSISPPTHDLPMEYSDDNNPFFLPGNHSNHININTINTMPTIPASISMAKFDDDISSPPTFWEHSMPPVTISKRHPNSNNSTNNQVISPAEIVPLEANIPFACNFRPRGGESESKPRMAMNINMNMSIDTDIGNMDNIESMKPIQGKEEEMEDMQFTPDFGTAFPPLAMSSGKAQSRYTFDMNAPSLVFGPPLSSISGSGSGPLSRSMMPMMSMSMSGSRTSSLRCDDGIRKGKSGASSARMPSKFCHICLRRGERIELLACTGLRCRKVTCEKCFIDFGWDYNYAKTLSDWTCCHCRGVCPERAQCFIYRRTNDRRHQQLVAKKQKGKRSILL